MKNTSNILDQIHQEYEGLEGKTVNVRTSTRGHDDTMFESPSVVTGVYDRFITVKNPKYGFNECINFTDILTNSAHVSIV